MLETIKRYAISSFDTFLAGFLTGIVPALNTLTVHDLSWGVLKATVLGIVLVGVRAGFKAVREYLVTKLAPKA